MSVVGVERRIHGPTMRIGADSMAGKVIGHWLDGFHDNDAGDNDGYRLHLMSVGGGGEMAVERSPESEDYRPEVARTMRPHEVTMRMISGRMRLHVARLPDRCRTTSSE